MLRNKISFSNLLIPVAFAAIVFSFFYSAGQFHAGQIQTPAPAEPQNENREVNLTNLSFEYGMLIQDTENNTYQFMIGDQLIPQNAPTRLDNMIRLLGGKQIRRPNFGVSAQHDWGARMGTVRSKLKRLQNDLDV